MTTDYKDFNFLKKLLPMYDVRTVSSEEIRCISNTGIEDKEFDSVTFPAIQKYFKGRLKEVYCNTCYNHKDMVVYFRARQKRKEQDAYDTFQSPSNIIKQFKQ